VLTLLPFQFDLLYVSDKMPLIEIVRVRCRVNSQGVLALGIGL